MEAGRSAAGSIRATAARTAFAARPASAPSRLSRLRYKFPCEQPRAGGWASSFQRAVAGDALVARCSWALSASRCCFFDSFFAHPLSTVSVNCCAPLSCVVSLLFSGLCCGLPAAQGGSLVGASVMVPSRRHVIVTPSRRARRAAWRRSCHWRALRDPRVAVGRAGCRGDGIVQVAKNSRDAGMPAVSSRGAWIAVHCALTSATREWPGQQPLHRLQRTEADGGPDCAAAI